MLYWLRSSSWIWSNACAQFLLVVADFNDASTSFFGQLFHVAKTKTLVPSAAIGDQNDVAHGVGLLRGLDSIADSQPAAFVLAIGKDDHGLATDFVLQLLVAAR